MSGHFGETRKQWSTGGSHRDLAEADGLEIAPTDGRTNGVERSEWDAAMVELSKTDASLREAVVLGQKVREGRVSANGATLPDEARDLHYIP